MNSHDTRGFRDLFSKLPARVQNRARAAYRPFRADPTHPSLHFKLVSADPPIYSARVGIGYRALGSRDGDTVIWYWIGPHAKYDDLLKRL